MNDLLTLDELADRLRVSRRTVERLRSDGALKAVHTVIGTRFELSEVERFIRANTRKMGSPEPSLPNRFTLYRFFDAEGALLYVGITGIGALRWTHHSKYQPWWTEVATIRVEHFPSLGAVRAAELAAIRSENPRYNKAGR